MQELTRNEELILLSIWKLEDGAYGVTIRDNFRRITGRTLNYGSLYSSASRRDTGHTLFFVHVYLCPVPGYPRRAVGPGR